ncbi:acetyl-CoA carboxylase biotin carboxyl carrier protein [Paenibacillus sp. BSR1-1]|uniref:acetyl-CoA carboxylase biotin carboxyl carrier protein n=1 Tax=Paenibacillus sp. BSR1-1 TaxID=3020845 RepID=UPI0025AFE98F|nr:acetyl-CoA carboxylase biotin carboxyl carrier protein [Paenibacillus sp. BSR1-1]MDN3015446.1 acetyl-CoA carboxylase biotin carboxyl carrier protein [Paenibacillus sp. BSR1-1]
MWKMHEIREMIKLFEESSLQEMELDLEDAGSKISLRKQENALDSYVRIEPPKAPVVSLAVKEAPVPVKKEIPKPVVQSEPVQEAGKKSIDANDPSIYKIISPMVGTFYQAPGEDADPFVKIGDKVGKSTIVCILEAMKLFNEIEAEVNGEIVEVLVKNGQLVEHGQPLFLVRME